MTRGFFDSFCRLDRGLDRVDRQTGRITFRFDLLHCDDPARNDETTRYRLDAQFDETAVTVLGDALPVGTEWMDGEILDLARTDSGARIGLSWPHAETGKTL